VHIYFEGMVQGVGFRYTAQRIASKLMLTGWVKNLSDGRVEAVCEGSEETISDFIEEMRSRSALSSYVRDIETEWSDATEGFTSFDIRF